MLREHCGHLTERQHDNRVYFTRVCIICGIVFKQRKRQPKKGTKP